MLLLHVESFLAIVRAGGLTRAAESLFITQPALTERLKLLEADLGAALFARTRSHGLQLTEAGIAFLPHAERIVRAAAEGADAIAFAGRAKQPALVIGIAAVAGMTVVERCVARYREIVSGPIRVRTGSEDAVVEMVLGREVELAIGHAVRHPDIQVIPLYRDEMILVAAPSHPLAGRAPVRMKDVADFQLIQVVKTLNRNYLARALPQGSTVGSGPMEVDNVEFAKLLVARGVGVGFLPQTEVADRLIQGNLVRIAISDAAPVRTGVVGLQRTDVPLSRGLETFIEIVRALDATTRQGRQITSKQRPRRPGA
jgi:DNA-binding transcriptional LysR family regulator